MLNAISLGAGVQSSTMALMAACGELSPMPDVAIFADTMAEPASVYLWLDWLEKQLPFPVVRVSKGDLGDAACRVRTSSSNDTYASFTVPAFIWDGNRAGIMRRQCTSSFKIEPIQKHLRFLVGKRERDIVYVHQWLGISLDEVSRMKPSREPWIENRWPLIDKGMSREDCLAWMKSHGYPKPPRSACSFCPFHGNKEWYRLKSEEPWAFVRAVVFERAYQAAYAQIPRVRGVPWLHRSLKPLDSINFDPDDGQLDLFQNECEGACGL